MIIKSLNNDYIKDLIKLKNKKYRDLTNTFLVEGDHLVEESLKNNLVKTLIVREGFEYKANVPIVYVTDEILKKLTDNDSVPSIMAIVYKQKEQDIKGNVVILDGIQDPGNLGTIIRNCVAFGINNLVLSTDTVDLYNSKVIRSTQGMIFSLNIQRRELTTFISDLKQKKYHIIGTDVSRGSDLKNIHISSPYAIILGNEGMGMKKEINLLCDDYIYIKLSDKCESLNVGVACGIILYGVTSK